MSVCFIQREREQQFPWSRTAVVDSCLCCWKLYFLHLSARVKVHVQNMPLVAGFLYHEGKPEWSQTFWKVWSHFWFIFLVFFFFYLCRAHLVFLHTLVYSLLITRNTHLSSVEDISIPKYLPTTAYEWFYSFWFLRRTFGAFKWYQMWMSGALGIVVF